MLRNRTPGERRSTARRRRATLALLMVTLPACGMNMDLTGLQLIFGEYLIGISVTQGAVVAVGDTIRMEATGQVSGAALILGGYDALPDAVWSISDPLVARLEAVQPAAVDSFPRARIRVRGLRVGQAVVSVSARGLTGTSDLRVVPAEPASPNR
jgi:hypothetical protein